MSEAEVYQFAKDLAKEAGSIIKKGFYETELNIEIKLDDCDLVTFYDKKVEQVVKDRISSKYPAHRFVGEETSAAGEIWSLDDEPTWIVDPIDGTTNFVHGFPFVCISIAYVVKKKIIIGVVYNPILDELYTAHRGQGSYLNDKRLPLRNPTQNPIYSVKDCLVMNEFGGMRDQPIMESKTKSMYRLSVASEAGGGHCRGVRCLGTAALNLCTVAKGSADLYWEVGPHVWDFAAGVLIVEEAGGMAISLPCNRVNNPDLPKPTLQQARDYDLLNRKVLAVRAIDNSTVDRSKLDSKQLDEADQKLLDVLVDAMNYFEDLEFVADGQLEN